MNQIPLPKSHEAVHPGLGGAEMVSTNQAQLAGQATTPGIPLQTYSQIPTRKANPPSCNLCRRRKVKCDRTDPCSHCAHVGAVCVSSAPSGAPRGRKGGRRKHDKELLDRVAKLENLVKDIERGTSGAIPAVPAAADGNHTV